MRAAGGRRLFYKSYKTHKSYAEALFPAWGDKHAEGVQDYSLWACP